MNMSDDPRLSGRNDAMTHNKKMVFILAGTLAAVAIGGFLFVCSGVYNIGADDHHTKIVLAIIEQLRDRSIAVRSNSIGAQYIEDPRRISAGARRYAALCVGCHLAPGVTKSDVRQGLYPHPPSLAQEELQPAQRTFWIIKHGIKMSGMPSWGKTMDDETIWDLVAFIRKLPDMTPESYRQISEGPSG
jgi:mono/diheme cytochrome c family protein